MGSKYVGGYQNYSPLLGPLNTRCRIILRTPKGTIILTTTHVRNHGPMARSPVELPNLLQGRDDRAVGGNGALQFVAEFGCFHKLWGSISWVSLQEQPYYEFGPC